MDSTCVLCGGAAAVSFEKNGLPIFRCGDCGHGFALPSEGDEHVADVYGDDYFFGGKDGYPNYLLESGLLTKRGRYYGNKAARYRQPGSILDVGAAAGFLLKGFAETGWTGVGLEPNQGMVDYGVKDLQLEMVQGTLETYQTNRVFDLVSLIQVIAHLSDVIAAFESLRRLTDRGSIVLVETWNEESMTAKVLGQNWHEYSPPSVLHWFSPKRLEDLFERFGFRQIAQGRTLKWISLRHGVSLASYVLGDRSSKALQAKISPNLAVPYPSEDLFWAIYEREG